MTFGAQSCLPLLDVCASHHGGNPESVAANLRAEPAKAATREQVYMFALLRGGHGVTADEIAAHWGTSHNHVAPRITELKRVGRLVPTQHRRVTRSGCLARVLIATT